MRSATRKRDEKNEGGENDSEKEWSDKATADAMSWKERKRVESGVTCQVENEDEGLKLAGARPVHPSCLPALLLFTFTIIFSLIILVCKTCAPLPRVSFKIILSDGNRKRYLNCKMRTVQVLKIDIPFHSAKFFKLCALFVNRIAWFFISDDGKNTILEEGLLYWTKTVARVKRAWEQWNGIIIVAWGRDPLTNRFATPLLLFKLPDDCLFFIRCLCQWHVDFRSIVILIEFFHYLL